MSLSGSALSRGGWALTAVAGLSVWFVAPHMSADIAAVDGSDFPRALLGLASMAQLAVAAWVIVVVGLTQVFGSTGVVRAVTPRVLRGALFASTAGALAIAPAQAERGADPPHDHAAVRVISHDLAGLPYPDRPQAERPPESIPPRRHVVIVQPGDTLWAISRRFLPVGSTDADVARSCGAWFAANRAVIGADPDLILPGQHLDQPITIKEHS